jgi:hypothetical protein
MKQPVARTEKIRMTSGGAEELRLVGATDPIFFILLKSLLLVLLKLYCKSVAKDNKLVPL